MLRYSHSESNSSIHLQLKVAVSMFFYIILFSVIRSISDVSFFKQSQCPFLSSGFSSKADTHLSHFVTHNTCHNKYVNDCCLKWLLDTFLSISDVSMKTCVLKLVKYDTEFIEYFGKNCLQIFYPDLRIV